MLPAVESWCKILKYFYYISIQKKKKKLVTKISKLFICTCKNIKKNFSKKHQETNGEWGWKKETYANIIRCWKLQQCYDFQHFIVFILQNSFL